ncbi:hypothetical protein CROQUDRAFT_667538 [Cronartium quercuum f. sp. fusiforme G11]|uniref:Uncharacterized protein n=1 Tax=Cronartium quercuum f. sp. fusiforme G11 TaxID=708437 RepID=A0A9P6TH90_9BASI|nr:hypothetical protein CROQUDRAFT_667538 [Cronartium quercuum f. sp. fusiforme G11]
MSSPLPPSATSTSMNSKLQIKLFHSNSRSGRLKSTPAPLRLVTQTNRSEVQNAPLLSPFQEALALQSKNRKLTLPPPPTDDLSLGMKTKKVSVERPFHTDARSISTRSHSLMRRSKDVLFRHFTGRNVPPQSHPMDTRRATIDISVPSEPKSQKLVISHSVSGPLDTSFLNIEEDSEYFEEAEEGEEESRPSPTVSDIETAFASPSSMMFSDDHRSIDTPHTKPIQQNTSARFSCSSTSTYKSANSLFSTSLPDTPTTASTFFSSNFSNDRSTYSSNHNSYLNSSEALLSSLKTLYDHRPLVAYQSQHLLKSEVEQWELRVNQNKSMSLAKQNSKLSSSIDTIT